jgi:hypothetical protein
MQKNRGLAMWVTGFFVIQLMAIAYFEITGVIGFYGGI